MADSGLSFEGQFQIRGGQSGSWLGWRPDANASKEKKWAKLTGLWLTDLGLMELEQRKGKVTGRFALRGGSEIEGKIAGRELKFKYQAFQSGKGWFDAAADGKTFAGAAADNGADRWFGWQGRRADEFVRHAKLEAGKIVDGSTTGLLTYSVRAPKGFKPDDGKKWPAIVILHGSNMNGKAYVSTIASAWPEVADDYLVIGLNGERPSDKGDDPRFNYTYVNYMGRSTYQGFPGTDRESPALVAEALDDLRGAYPIERYFVGGHSQGGYLTYSLLMNFPDKIAGAFPISAGVIMQCEPTVFDDAPLREAQRAVPLAIVHGKQDPVVDFSSGQYAATIFGEAGWPAFRFVADDSPAGHRFALLPVGETIRWLEAQSSDDPGKLIDFAEKRFKARGYRDAAAALARARKLAADEAVTKRLDRLAKQLDAKAKPGAAKLLPKIKARADGKTWIDDFLTYRDDFEFAPAAHEAMEAFAALRAEHEGPAKQVARRCQCRASGKASATRATRNIKRLSTSITPLRRIATSSAGSPSGSEGAARPREAPPPGMAPPGHLSKPAYASWVARTPPVNFSSSAAWPVRTWA